MSNTGVKLVCLLVALVLWVQVASTQDVEEIVQLPLTVVGLPDSLVVRADSLPEKVGVRIRGSKLQLLRDQIVHRGFGRVEVPLSDATPGPYEHPVTVLDVRSAATPLEIVPDLELQLQVHRRVSRAVPVRLAVDGQLPAGFTMAGRPEISPSSVEVTGPQPLVEALAHVSTEPLRLDRQRGSFTQRIGLALRDPSLRVRPVEVEVAVGVDEVRERLFSEVPLSILNALAPERVHVDPAHAQVRVVGGGGAVDALRVEDIAVLLQVEDLEPGVYQLTPEVVVPDGIASTSVEPPSFQVIVEAVEDGP